MEGSRRSSFKAKRLHLIANKDGSFNCPVEICDSSSFRSQRGCRKHVYTKHGWYYYFDKRPNPKEVLPKQLTTQENGFSRPKKKSNTTQIPMFLKDSNLSKLFRIWLCSAGGGSKGKTQADQICTKVLKYLKFCCQDMESTWEIPDHQVDYCLGSVSMISDFVEFLSNEWKVGYAGIIGYMSALSNLLDYRRVIQPNRISTEVFIASEIYMQRVKKSLSKKMKAEWAVLLSIDYLSSIKCWATLEELQNVIPCHSNRFAQIMLNTA